MSNLLSHLLSRDKNVLSRDKNLLSRDNNLLSRDIKFVILRRQYVILRRQFVICKMGSITTHLSYLEISNLLSRESKLIFVTLVLKGLHIYYIVGPILRLINRVILQSVLPNQCSHNFCEEQYLLLHKYKSALCKDYIIQIATEAGQGNHN